MVTQLLSPAGKSGGRAPPLTESQPMKCVIGGFERNTKILGHREVLLEIQRQVSEVRRVIATGLREAVQRAAPQEGAQRRPTVAAPVLKGPMLLNPLMQRWINGEANGKVQLKSVQVQGKRVLVAVPPHRRQSAEDERSQNGSERASPR